MLSRPFATQPISIAIVGGGIGGLCLALGLLKYDHLDVHIYESAPTFGEIGAGVGIGPNAQAALTLLSPEARAAYDKHASGNLWPKHAKFLANFVVGEGKHEGELIHSLANASGQQSVHRARFLEDLVKSVPADRAHFNKRLESLEDNPDGPVVIHFRDGTAATADAVIAADGSHSTARNYILGQPSEAVFAGSVAYRALIPMDEMVEKFGEEFAHNAFFLCGNGGSSFSYPIESGARTNLVLFDNEPGPWEHESWVAPVDPEAVRSKFSTWGASARGLVELFLAKPNPTAWALCDHPPAPTYTKGRVVMMGDAAHATTPYQGQGAGQAIEDASVLAALLEGVFDPETIPTAFMAFDQVRRVRSQRVVTTSRDHGDLVSMRAEGIGSDLKAMKRVIARRFNWIWNRDLADQRQQAVTLFREAL